jgi:phosphoribosylanthranilate isomerase
MTTAAEPPFVIKICGITNEEDARTAVAAGANALGFNFYPKSPRYVTFTRAQEIIQAVPGDYLKVGVFVNPRLEDTAAVYRHLADVVQLHGNQCPPISNVRVWKAINAGQDNVVYPSAEAYLLDTPCETFGGSGKVFDWKLAADRPFRVLIAGGLDASNVAGAIATALPWGVDACSRLESGPGKKDPRKLEAFVSVAQQAFRSLLQQEVNR